MKMRVERLSDSEKRIENLRKSVKKMMASLKEATIKARKVASS